MKRNKTVSKIIVGAILVILASAGTASAQAYNGWLAGYVTASQIAEMGTRGTGSFGITISLWMKKIHCEDEADCARKLVASGGKYVVVINEKTYELSNQKLAVEHVGMGVLIKGVLDDQKHTINITAIQDYEVDGICQ